MSSLLKPLWRECTDDIKMSQAHLQQSFLAGHCLRRCSQFIPCSLLVLPGTGPQLQSGYRLDMNAYLQSSSRTQYTCPQQQAKCKKGSDVFMTV